MGQKAMPSMLERYELKYLIPESMIEPISDFASIYCSPDKYSQLNADGYYHVYSLYLDSPNYLFLKKRMDGSDNRFNMRIRTYDAGTAMPCFFEIKQKRGRIIKKYRAAIFDENWPELFDSPSFGPGDLGNGSDIPKAELFLRMACSHNAGPKVLTQYRRKAFVSDVDDYARVTFDTDLKCQHEDRFNLIPEKNLMMPYDNAAVFDPECNVILELKCYTTQVPLWMIDLIHYFNLKQGRFSKYASSLAEALGLFGYDTADRLQTHYP